MARPANMKVELDEEEIQAPRMGVTVSSACTLGKLAPERGKSAQNLLACEHRLLRLR